MKILLVGINAKYSHTALAVDYIYQACKDLNIEKLEFNINQEIEYIYGEIISKKPDIIAFSTYIWNIEYVSKLTSDLGQTCPAILIWGGLEASFDVDEHFSKNPQLDIIVRGEGEITNKKLFLALEKGDIFHVDGISYRSKDKIAHNPSRKLIEDLDTIASPFLNMDSQPGKMVYYEMSRGCPFSCTYCLSSSIKGLRYFSLDRIKSDLIHIISSGASVVKLVDRTFNANEEFSMEVMDFIVDHAREGMVFHMELMAHLISDKFLKYLSKLPKGLFQFEIGIQSSNEKTLKEIRRVTNLDRLAYVVKKIRSFGNIHQHVDLIAGLPYEDYDSFKESFDYACSLDAEKIQLGFLKVLRGSQIAGQTEKHQIIYSSYPPYEIKANKYISAQEIRRLKIIEDLVEKFHNEDYFYHTINYLLKDTSPFEFYESFSYWWEEKGYHKLAHSRKSLYKILFSYLENRKDLDQIRELLRLDHVINNRGNPGPYLKPKEIDNKEYHQLIQDQKLREKFGLSLDTTTKKLVKDFRFEKFEFSKVKRVYGIDYKNNNYSDITDDYERIINGK